MPWFSLKHCLFGGRQVKPGDPLPEVDRWGRGQIDRRVEARRIAFAPDGHVVVVLPGGAFRVVPAPPDPPPAPVQTEHRTPTPAVGAESVVVESTTGAIAAAHEAAPVQTEPVEESKPQDEPRTPPRANGKGKRRNA